MGIPTMEELKLSSSNNRYTRHDSSYSSDADTTPDTTPDSHISRDELVQSLVWAQARNDALSYMKDQLRAQIIEERKLVTSYQGQIRDLEDQGYSIGL